MPAKSAVDIQGFEHDWMGTDADGVWRFFPPQVVGTLQMRT
jgi:hypothetical protein